MIGSREVRGPDGSAWTIERHWAPRPRWMKGFKGLAERRRGRRKERRSAEGGADDAWELFRFFDGSEDLGLILLVIGALVAIVLAVWLGWPFFVFLFDTLLFIPLVLLTVLTRIVFRRPWTLEASTALPTGGSRSVVWNVSGWRASSKALERMAQMIRLRGEPSDVPPDSTPAAHRRARR